MSGNEVLTAVTDGYRLPNPADKQITCPPRLYEIMTKCWQAEPDERPSFAELRDFFYSLCAELDAPYDAD